MNSIATRPIQLGFLVFGAFFFSAYVTVMIGTLAPLGDSVLILLFVAIFVVGLLLCGCSIYGVGKANKERVLSAAQRKVEFRPYEDEDLCQVSDATKARALFLLGPDPLTGETEEVVFYLAREKLTPLVFQTIFVVVCGTALAWYAGTYHRYQTAGANTPRRRKDDVFLTIDLPVGVPMGIILLTGLILFVMWVRWESTLHMITAHFMFKMKTYPGWLYLFINDRFSHMPHKKIDFGSAHRGILGRVFGYGRLSQDAAPQEDQRMRRLRRIRKFQRFIQLSLALKKGKSVASKAK